MKWYACPDRAESITALANSVLRHYGCATHNPTLPEADAILETAPRNVVLFLMDGMGRNILTHHLPEDSFLRRHWHRTLSSVFPPTTSAAATALETGLFAAQSGWLGWTVYWPPLDENVTLFRNCTDDGTPLPINVGEDCLTRPMLVQAVRDQGIPAWSVSEFGELCEPQLSGVLDRMKSLCTQPGPHFFQAYVKDPDHLLHDNGCTAPVVGDWLREADRLLEDFSRTCPDTLVLLTADHGHTDVDPLFLDDFPQLSECLVRLPSVEPRALNLFVKPEHLSDFPARFRSALGDQYQLLTRQEVLDSELFGPRPWHPRFLELLGDFLAIAVDRTTLFYKRSTDVMKSTHAGMTPQELTVPLIVWTTDV